MKLRNKKNYGVGVIEVNSGIKVEFVETLERGGER